MPLTLYFDTETTGLLKPDVMLSDPSQPRLVQLAAVLQDEEPPHREYGALTCLIQPDGWSIPEEMTAIHGIRTEVAAAAGIQLKQALWAFAALAARADVVCGHNAYFDVRMLDCAAAQAGMSKVVMRTIGLPRCCTALLSRPICRIPPPGSTNPNATKLPKLVEAYRHFFGEDLAKAHTAEGDVRAVIRVDHHLRTLGV